MAEGLTMTISPTPNPHAIKLTLNRSLGPQGKTFRQPLPPGADPWAKALLEIEGVVGVFGIHSFISINKAQEADWDVIVPQAEAALRRVFHE